MRGRCHEGSRLCRSRAYARLLSQAPGHGRPSDSGADGTTRDAHISNGTTYRGEGRRVEGALPASSERPASPAAGARDAGSPHRHRRAGRRPACDRVARGGLGALRRHRSPFRPGVPDRGAGRRRDDQPHLRARGRAGGRPCLGRSHPRRGQRLDDRVRDPERDRADGHLGGGRRPEGRGQDARRLRVLPRGRSVQQGRRLHHRNPGHGHRRWRGGDRQRQWHEHGHDRYRRHRPEP